MSVDKVTACVLSLLQNTSAPRTRTASFQQPSRDLFGIERLPTELLGQISVHLPAYSALALHRTSRTLAMKVPLDNNFWRTTIMNGTALPYLWDLNTEELEEQRREHSAVSTDPEAMWDWKSIGQLLATKHFPLKSSDPRIVELPNGLWNRGRIWSIVEKAYADDLGNSATKNRNDSVFEERKKREPVFDWQVEEIMEDLGHYS